MNTGSGASLVGKCLLTCCFALASLVVSPASEAFADTLRGKVTDAATGVAIADAEVRVLGVAQTTRTGAQGEFAFELPPGRYDLEVNAVFGGTPYRARFVNQYVPQYRESHIRVYTEFFLDQGHEALPAAFGLPSGSGRAPVGAGPVDVSDLFDVASNAVGLSLPSTTPTRIRVGMRQDETGSAGCSGSSNPVVAIEEMELDEYVKGVLPPEIGVFRNIPGVREVYKAFAIAAKSYGLYFMLVYDENNRRDVGRALPPSGFTWFHIDNTACNQRYSSDRLNITTESAIDVANKILVARSDANQLDKYEYAASCGRNGTRPEYQTALVPDRPSENACAGSWCGHDSCAGHEDNPTISGSDRCLVRGICQWGAASWGQEGKSYTWMLDHYQPNLQLRDLSGAQEPVNGVTLTGYIHTNSDDISGSGVSGVEVSLDTGESTTTDGVGLYRFDDVTVASAVITAAREGYLTATRTKELQPGVTNWASLLITAREQAPDAGPSDAGAPDAGAPVVDAGQDAGEATGADASPNDVGVVDTTEAPTFGALVAPSRGSSGGCGCAASDEPPALNVAWLLLGFLILRRGRRLA